MIIWYFNPIKICHLSSKKSQLNLLYKLNEKDNFILQKFQTPPLSLFLPFLKIAKSQMPFFLSPSPDASPFAISLPYCAAGEDTAQHRRFRP
jgi:hypothetical protein